jgi:hypothetical protein
MVRDILWSGAVVDADSSGRRWIVAPDARQPSGYLLAQMDEIESVPCPCGMSRRAFVTPDNKVASLHQVDISIDARTHYHKKLTEIY